uniref:Uncharacterized protein n=1 Tax=Tanacetum cinerariifolium TaxID=118510 RepID=A0A699I057_TANCI|nr:hypothetical protein [Tanacetum cinerariifolium]
MLFDCMLRNLNNVSGRFLMYPRFIQTFLDKQLDGLPTHEEKYDVSFHIKKVFANMKRIGKGFSGKKTSLFPTMVGPNQVQMGEGSVQPTDTQHTPTFDMPPLNPKKTQKPRQTKKKNTKVSQPKDELKRTKTAQQIKIDGLERRVKKLEKKNRSRTHKLKRLYKVGLTTRMLIDTVVDAAQVTTTIADVPVSAAKTIVNIAPTTTTESTKTNVKLLHNNLRFKTMVKEKLIEEHVKLKKRGQILFDEEVARKLQEEIYEQERLVGERARHEEEANSALIKTWEDIQAKVNVDYQLAERLQAKEQEQLTNVEKAKLFMKFMKKKDEAETAQESSSKRAGDELDQERSKKQKVEDDKEFEELKRCLEIIPDDEDDVTIDATPLSTNKLLKNFDREDLEVLWKLVKERFVKTIPVDHMDSFLMHNLMTMFEHHLEDNVWKIQQGLAKVKI